MRGNLGPSAKLWIESDRRRYQQPKCLALELSRSSLGVPEDLQSCSPAGTYRYTTRQSEKQCFNTQARRYEDF